MKRRIYKGRDLLPLAVSDAARAGDADDKFADFPVQAVGRPVTGRSADKIGRFPNLMLCCGDFTPCLPAAGKEDYHVAGRQNHRPLLQVEPRGYAGWRE